LPPPPFCDAICVRTWPTSTEPGGGAVGLLPTDVLVDVLALPPPAGVPAAAGWKIFSMIEPKMLIFVSPSNDILVASCGRDGLPKVEYAEND
jgi:hypothetical protein